MKHNNIKVVSIPYFFAFFLKKSAFFLLNMQHTLYIYV